MEVALKSPSPLPAPEAEVVGQVWDFVEGQCFPGTSGTADTANVTFWLRTLLQQNSDLVEAVARLEAAPR